MSVLLLRLYTSAVTGNNGSWPSSFSVGGLVDHSRRVDSVMGWDGSTAR
jgi:hypothetical protein